MDFKRYIPLKVPAIVKRIPRDVDGNIYTQIKAIHEAIKFPSIKIKGENKRLFGNKKMHRALTPNTAVTMFSSRVKPPKR